MRKAFAAARGGDFDQVLSEVRQADRQARDGEKNFVRFATAAPFPPGEAESGAWRWDEALAWIGEPDDPAAPGARNPRLSESLEAIARELALDNIRTLAELSALRRLFMWRNHPDRVDEAQRGAATRRVALANMLIDRAQARLAGERPTRS